jgi:hypothetical protein
MSEDGESMPAVVEVHRHFAHEGHYRAELPALTAAGWRPVAVVERHVPNHWWKRLLGAQSHREMDVTMLRDSWPVN